MEKTAFIINPQAGTKASRPKIKLVNTFAKKHGHDVFVTESRDHARRLALELKTTYDKLVVFGGDGTINEVASSIINSDVQIGIIPAGSGNGLANHLGIPTDTDHALRILDKPARTVDAIQVNDEIIINVGGLGFDGHVANLFNKSKSRGNLTYARLILTQLFAFKEQEYSLEIDKAKITGKAFMLAFANGSEFGNRFIIDPLADTTDGEFSLIVVRKPPMYRLIPLLIDGFRGKLKESQFYQRYSLKELSISSPGAALHRDGEVADDPFTDTLNLKILPSAIKVIY